MYYQKYDYIGKRHFFTFLIAISVAEMHNGWYCLRRNWNGNIVLYFEKKFFSSSLIHCERERERGRSIGNTWEGLSMCERHFGTSSLKRENKLCSNDQSNVFEGRSYLFLKHHGRETTRGTERGCAWQGRFIFFTPHARTHQGLDEVF